MIYLLLKILCFHLSDVRPPHRGHNVRPRPHHALALLDVLVAGPPDVSERLSNFFT